jgi:Predicted protease
MAPTRRKWYGLLAAGAAALALTGLAASPAAAAPAGIRNACAMPAAPHAARCFAEYVAPGAATSAPAGASTLKPLTPAGLRSAYRLPANAGTGMTVGIVDAQDDPRAEADVNAFRAKYQLPACTSASGCFRKVNENGKATPLPAGDPGWGVEISLDLDAVSSVCPACHILLVEGNTPSLQDLGIAVNTAVRLGAGVVSNSYGTDEFNGMTSYASYYHHSGVPILVSSGDYGFGIAQFPAVLSTTVAVGGTTLSRDTSSTARGWRETAWNSAASGCSAYIQKPAWQHDTHCLMRMVADLSADADPRTGLLVRDSYGYPGTVQVGGTSLSSPLVAAMIALTGKPSAFSPTHLYTDPKDINDIVGGSNGYCGGDYLCKAVPGYDGPTGVGTPRGLGAL